MENISLKLHDCRIARRGKAAKGTVAVKTFGIPVLDKKTGIANGWSYAPFVNLAHNRIVEQVKECIKVSDAMLNKALLIGLDVMQKSESARTSTDIELLANRIQAAGLSIDMAEAKSFAKLWIPGILTAIDVGWIPSMEDGINGMLAKRKIAVDKLKAAGQWAIVQPANTHPLKDETESDELESEDSDDSDDSEEEVSE